MGMSPYMKGLREKVGSQLLGIPAVGVALLDERRRLLVGCHASGNVYVVPGGAVEPEEEPEAAAIREVREETGLTVSVDEIIGVYGGPDCTVVYPNGDRTSYMIAVYAGTVLSGELRPDREEFQSLRYVALDELRSLRLAPWLPKLLGDLEKDNQG